MTKKRLIVVQNSWRLDDNILLEVNDPSNYLIGCIDSRWSEEVNGYRKRSVLYQNFAIASAIEFQYALNTHHQIQCPIYHSKPKDLIAKILTSNPDITHLRLEEPVAYDEQQVVDIIQHQFKNIKLELVWSNSLYDFDDMKLDSAQFKKSFTAWRKKLECKPISIEPTQLNLESHQFQSLPNMSNEIMVTSFSKSFPNESVYRPGEQAGLSRLEYYLFQSHHVNQYKNTRNQLLGLNYSSKFSPWLAHGVISPKRIFSEINRYEASVHKNESTYWLKFELLWREFFRHAMRLQKRAFFLAPGIQNKLVQIDSNQTLFQQWAQGRNGVDFIDANMVELNCTGYMSNRGRQNVASFLIHQLQQDWRFGAAYFESKLIDYDVSSNWCNWAYLAGVGHDPRNRVFNIQKQQQMYDSDDRYIKYWLG